MSSNSSIPEMRLPFQILLPTPPASSVGSFFVAVRLRHNSGAMSVSVTSHPSRLQWPWSGFTPGNTIAHIRDFSITSAIFWPILSAALSPAEHTPFVCQGCFPIHHVTKMIPQVVLALSGGAQIATRLLANISSTHSRWNGAGFTPNSNSAQAYTASGPSPRARSANSNSANAAYCSGVSPLKSSKLDASRSGSATTSASCFLVVFIQLCHHHRQDHLHYDLPARLIVGLVNFIIVSRKCHQQQHHILQIRQRRLQLFIERLTVAGLGQFVPQFTLLLVPQTLEFIPLRRHIRQSINQILLRSLIVQQRRVVNRRDVVAIVTHYRRLFPRLILLPYLLAHRLAILGLFLYIHLRCLLLLNGIFISVSQIPLLPHRLPLNHLLYLPHPTPALAPPPPPRPFHIRKLAQRLPPVVVLARSRHAHTSLPGL